MDNKKRPVDLESLFGEMTDCEFAMEGAAADDANDYPSDVIPFDDEFGEADIR